MSDGQSGTAPAANVVTTTAVDTTPNAGSISVVDVTPIPLDARLNAGQEATETTESTEKPETPKTEEKPKREKVASKLASVKQREAALAAREAEIEQRAKDAEAKLEEANKRAQLVEDLKKSPSKVLSELGMTFNDLAEAVLSEEVGENATPSELEEVKQALKEIEGKLSAKEQKELEDQQKAAKAEADAVDAQVQAAIADIKVVIDNHLNANPEQYDLILTTGSQPLVYEIMEESFKQTGEVMMYNEACDLAEEYLAKRAQELATKSKKIQKFVSPTPVEKPKRTSFGSTLSQQVTQVAAAGGKGPDMSKLSHEERIRVLAGRLRFN